MKDLQFNKEYQNYHKFMKNKSLNFKIEIEIFIILWSMT